MSNNDELDPSLAEMAESEHWERQARARVKQLERQLERARTGEDAWRAAIASNWMEPLSVRIRPTPREDKRKTVSERICVVHVSDTQIGKVTSTYSTEVCAERLERLADKIEAIIEAQRTHYKIEECRLYLGGDIVEGENVFPTQPHFIDSPVIDQAVTAAPQMLAELASRLAGLFRSVRVVCVRGNHGRGGKFDRTNPRTNWDSVSYRVLKLLIDNSALSDRVKVVNQDEKFWAVDYVYDWGFLLVHGDQIKGHLLPWYGVSKKASGWQDSLSNTVDGYAVSAPWDYLMFGHFHTYCGPVVQNRRVWMCNGTTESDNEYAQEGLAACGEPVQRVGLVSRDRGYEADFPVYLGEQGRLPQRRMAAIQAREVEHHE